MAWSRSFAVGGLEHKVPEPWLHDRPFRLEEIPGRGLGAVATKDLLPGDVVLLERPILAIRSDEKGTEPTAMSGIMTFTASARKVYKALSEEGRAEVWKLHDACLQKPEKSLEGILFTNCIGRDQTVRFDAALCLALSRFNHSCCPNLEQSWDEDAGHVPSSGDVRVSMMSLSLTKVRLVAAQPVKAGEELFTHYAAALAPRPFVFFRALPALRWS
ncbi:set5 [Symbiodinium necroappetens]|uniref:Set5 protein n=1 Tax=Symbiodinium necroappetens TaxID=1628268 RepID=A0A812KUQ2_9DINO|nr:set5 [Symbiodinium necroappetens]